MQKEDFTHPLISTQAGKLGCFDFGHYRDLPFPHTDSQLIPLLHLRRISHRFPVFEGNAVTTFQEMLGRSTANLLR